MKWWEVFLELYTITITRQFGSMGQAIARQMAQMLGIEYYDREILEKVSEQTGLMMSTIKDEEERAQNRFGFMRFPLGRQTTDMQDKIFKVQEQIILELAEQQSCIIVGRCADYILRDFPNAVNNTYMHRKKIVSIIALNVLICQRGKPSR